ncbi:helix-turn-helix domain-containing protein [[Enterobacter] lignolyticus]|uniref:Inhibitor of hydrogen peroxide resistance n=2 Tax=[Enterobacter] lignolyticus TaxID=1334193 RepID=E3G7I5_ENTLS|nr:helix-turn-helix domain-containing protein [[Enterobacter] lignolyticus]ADO49685.1 putative DNA-binding transcriptional regulator [[Enterobacter] lignolyticus SCF1]ALR75648.1 hypothetical protein AO703_04810 [[Enterobacter] lignolyticus]
MLTVKPLSAFAVLDKRFSAGADAFSLTAQQSLLLANADDAKITVIRHGAVKISRMQQELLVGIATAPLILGLPCLQFPGVADYQLTAVEPCDGYQLNAEKGAALLEKHQLWQAAFCWLSWQYRVVEMRDIQLVGRSSYSQIRESLHLMQKWEPALRARVGVMSYIQQRTRISRSVIAEVLAALRQGNYIEMDKGKLVRVHRLPLEY